MVIARHLARECRIYFCSWKDHLEILTESHFTLPKLSDASLVMDNNVGWEGKGGREAKADAVRRARKRA